MSSSVGSVNSITPSWSLFESKNIKETDNSKIPFADYLKDALNNANSLMLESDRISSEFAAGNIDNIDEVTIAATKADMAFQFTLQIRNKILDAYSEIMRMQI